MHHTKLPRILTANIRSTINKLDEIYLTVSSRKYHIFAACETWLREDIPDQVIDFPNYQNFRCDRLTRAGGGVCIWTHLSVNVFRLNPSQQLAHTEAVWLCLPQSKIILACLYIPPDKSISEKSSINDYIISNADDFLYDFPSYDVVLCGDFNQYNVQPLIESLDLINKVNEPTRNAATLDYFLVSNSISSDFSVQVCAEIGTSDHKSISAIPTKPKELTMTLQKTLFDLRRSNTEQFLNALSTVNWTTFYLSEATVDEKCDFFHSTLSELVHAHIPASHVTMTSSDKPWVTPLVKYAIQKRWDAYRRKDFENFSHWKRKTKYLIDCAKRSWSLKAQKNTKDMWKFVKSETSGNTTNQIYQLLHCFENVDDAVNQINETFVSVFQTAFLPPVPKSTQNAATSNTSWSTDISPELVYAHLSKINPAKSMGSDRIPSILYKMGAHFLAEPLCHLFNISLSERKFPTLWKLSHITPVPKSKPVNPKSLRPIALLPIPSKIFEKIVLQSMQQHFLRNLGANQFGSRPSSSTTCAIISIVHSSLSLLELANVSGVQIIAYDYSKAFDTLSHELISRRMTDLSFPSSFVEWIQSYLSGRSQAVRIGNVVSATAEVTSGVPQGSVLGPLLFCLVTGELKPLHPSTHIVKYVDDTTLCIPLYKCSDNNHVEAEHMNIIKWSSTNGFKLNLDKCKSICFRKTRRHQPVHLDNVENVNKLKLLGVMLSSKLDWHYHVRHVCSLAAKRMFALRILAKLFDKKNLVEVYNATIRSLLEYASPAFGNLPEGLSTKLERVQRRCHRIICRLGQGEQCQCNYFEPLVTRRHRAMVKLFIGAANSKDHILHKLVPGRSSRSGRFLQPFSHTSRYRSSFAPYVTTVINNTLIT